MNSIFHDKNGGIVLGQAPNWQIVLAGFSYLMAKLNFFDTYDYFNATAIIFFSFWAYEELINGVNYFRKALGAIGLLIIFMKLV